jgi:hypothetical protein
MMSRVTRIGGFFYWGQGITYTTPSTRAGENGRFLTLWMDLTTYPSIGLMKSNLFSKQHATVLTYLPLQLRACFHVLFWFSIINDNFQYATNHSPLRLHTYWDEYHMGSASSKEKTSRYSFRFFRIQNHTMTHLYKNQVWLESGVQACRHRLKGYKVIIYLRYSIKIKQIFVASGDLQYQIS